MYRNKTIEMSDRASGNWYPYNMDGTQHDCRNQTQVGTGTKKIEAKRQEPNVTVNQQRLGPLTIEELDTRLKRVGSLAVSQNDSPVFKLTLYKFDTAQD